MIKKPLFVIFSLLFFCGTAFAQVNEKEYWKNWNANYPTVDIVPILKHEQYYADSVEKHPQIAPYYFRIDKYRFAAKYMGKQRPIDPEVINSIKRVFKLTQTNVSQVDKLFDNEVLMDVNGMQLWMPMQKNILQGINEEVKSGEMINLYCLYINEHTSANKLYNLFLISEFVK